MTSQKLNNAVDILLGQLGLGGDFSFRVILFFEVLIICIGVTNDVSANGFDSGDDVPDDVGMQRLLI